mgnify:CR=1 FL=1
MLLQPVCQWQFNIKSLKIQLQNSFKSLGHLEQVKYLKIQIQIINQNVASQVYLAQDPKNYKATTLQVY